MSRNVLNNPPILEAVLEIQFLQEQGISELGYEDKELEDIMSILKDKYSKNERHYRQRMDIKFGNKPPLNKKNISPTVIVGLKLTNENDKIVYQIFKDKIAVSKLEPYSSFENLLNELISVFDLLKEIYSTKKINRIGVRYVNKIQTQNTDVNYLKVTPFLFKNSTFDTEVSHNQSVFRIEDCKALLNYRYNNFEKYALIDIDAYKIFNEDEVNFKVIKLYFEKLRKIKNNLFFKILSYKEYNEI